MTTKRYKVWFRVTAPALNLHKSDSNIIVESDQGMQHARGKAESIVRGFLDQSLAPHEERAVEFRLVEQEDL